MVVKVLERELELMILQEIIVTSVTVCDLLVHLCRSKRCVSLIRCTLKPYGVRPL